MKATPIVISPRLLQITAHWKEWERKVLFSAIRANITADRKRVADSRKGEAGA